MPSNTQKSAAVPFVNQKGERSMKRVKVERYVAGKRPAYAKDEDDEYYTTDEGENDEEFDDSNEEPSEHEDSDYELKPGTSNSYQVSMENKHDDDDDKRMISDLDGHIDSPKTSLSPIPDDDDDDPRFRRLKQVETKSNSSRLLEAQISSKYSMRKFEDNVILDDDEDEAEARQRHAIARARILEDPIGPQAVLGNFTDQFDTDQSNLEGRNQKTNFNEQTEDILKDLKLSGIKPKQRKNNDFAAAELKAKEIIERAKEEATFKAQTHKKFEEDNKRELEMEALSKDIPARDVETVKTDDEDDEIAYELWKLREIKRVSRYRSERALRTSL